MTNTFMAEFYAMQAAEVAKAAKIKNNVVVCKTAELANLIPTPTAAELNSIMNGEVVELAGSLVSPNKVMRPHPALFVMQKKYPTRT